MKKNKINKSQVPGFAKIVKIAERFCEFCGARHLRRALARKRSSPAKKQISSLFILLLLMLFSLSSCVNRTVYKRPSVATPDKFRADQSAADQSVDSSAKPSFGELYWGDLVKDPVLKDLMNTALKNNYDLRIAVEKILEYEARFGVVRADLYPAINGEGLNQSQKTSRNSPSYIPGYPEIQHYTQLDLNLSYEFDFWGRVKRTADAARATLLGTENAKNTVLITLISDVASGYFQLRELDLELEISKETLTNRLESLRLVTAREKYGKATMLDVDQSKSLVLQAQTAITNIERQIEQQENYLNYLLGKNPGPIQRGLPLPQQLAKLAVPPGLPSALLASRPDIQQAEQTLIAAGANVDVARASFYPQITLTGLDGTLSQSFSNLFKDPSAIWLVTPKLTLPIFNAGKIASNVRITESQQRQALLQYAQTIQGAFREVSDSLVGYQKQRIYAAQQKDLADTSQDQARLSNLRYIGGVTSYLEVLDSETQYYNSEIQYAQASLGELQYIIKLYKALGGGWKQKQ